MKIFSYDNLVSVLTKIQTKINDVLSIANTAQSTADTNATNISTLRSSVSTNTSNISTNTEAINKLNENLSSIDMFSVGTSVSSGDDLDNYTTPGKYYSASSSVTNTISNAPNGGAGFSLYVLYQGGNFRLQIFTFNQNSAAKAIYFRIRNASAWGSWYVIDATVVT